MAETGLDLTRAGLADAAIETTADLISAVELNNLCVVGLLMAKAALLRRESRGGHYREDHPEKNEAKAQSIVLDINQPEKFVRVRLCDR